MLPVSSRQWEQLVPRKRSLFSYHLLYLARKFEINEFLLGEFVFKDCEVLDLLSTELQESENWTSSQMVRDMDKIIYGHTRDRGRAGEYLRYSGVT